MIKDGEPTKLILEVSKSTIKGYPHASISSKRSFEWTLQKTIRSNTLTFKFLFLHVQIMGDDDYRFLRYFLYILYLVAETREGGKKERKKGKIKT